MKYLLHENRIFNLSLIKRIEVSIDDIMNGDDHLIKVSLKEVRMHSCHPNKPTEWDYVDMISYHACYRSNICKLILERKKMISHKIGFEIMKASHVVNFRSIIEDAIMWAVPKNELKQEFKKPLKEE